MRTLLPILFLLLCLTEVRAQSEPVLTATWIAPGQAIIAWSQPGNLYVDGVWLGRFAGSGQLALRPGVECDQTRFPRELAVYTLKGLVEDHELGRAQLGEEPKWYKQILGLIVTPPGMAVQCA